MIVEKSCLDNRFVIKSAYLLSASNDVELGEDNVMKHLGTQLLETERLLARPFQSEDIPLAFKNWTSDDEVTRFLTWPTHKSEEDTKAFLDFCIAHYDNPHFYQWGIVLKETGELIGNIAVVNQIEKTQEAELGWALGRSWWGNSYMAEMAKAVIDFLIKDVGFNRVKVAHDSLNKQSGRVMEKAGMTYEGTMRQAGKNNRGIVDMSQYGIIKKDLR